MGYLVFGQREARLSSFGHIGKGFRAAAVGAALIAGSAAWSSAQAQGPIYVSQAGELINAFNQAATYTQQTGGTTTIILTQTIVLQSQIVVNANVNFDGGSFVLDAVNNDRVLFIAGGTVNVSNLTIAGGLAKGGNGADGGGGGAGLGGGLFVASGKDIPGSNVTLATNVTLSNVAFNGNQVVGGNGAEYHTFGGGGGGMGGNGGVGYFFNAAENSGGGGGGFGVGANGGDAFYIDQTQVNLGQLGAFAWGQFFSGNPGGSGLGDNGDTGLGTVTTPGGFWGGGGGGSQAHGNYFLTPGNPSNNGGGGGVNGGNAGPTGAYATAGAGGFGGGGGGGSVGANGGFGGGGGGSNSGGRNLLYGGFGGGAGSSPQNAASAGGFGGGDAYNGSHSAGGGGAGLGGAIYVMRGVSLTIGDGVTFNGNSVTGGSGGTANAGNGINAGAALFLGANVTFSITSGNTVTITQDLAGGAADSRTGDPGNNGLPYSQNPYAQGGISVIGGGSLVLGATNSYVGATQVLDGTLTLDGGALPYSKIYVGGSIAQDATLELINGGSANSIVVGAYGGSTSAVVIGSPTGTGGTITGDISFATGNTQLVFNQLDDGNPYSFGLLLTGPGAVYQNGAGTTILTNALNTYSGGTFVNAGTLQVGGLGALPGSGTVTINGGSLDINGLDLSIGALALFTGGTVVDSLNSGALSAASITASGGVIAASLNGSGDILQQLSGTLELGGTNQYVGETRVTGGILNVTGSLHGSQVTVTAGGALQGTGEIGETVTIESGGAISSGNNPDTLHLENLTLQTGAQSAFELDVNGTRNPITVNGIFDFGGIVNVVFIDPLDPSVISVFPLFHYDENNEFHDNGALIGEAPAGYNLRIATDLNPGRVDLLVSYDGLQFWNGTPADNGGDGVWNLANANWTDPTGTVMGDPWDNSGQMTAVFRGTAGTVQVADDLTVAGLQFVTDGYELTAAGGSLILGSAQTEIRINSTATATLSVELSGSHGLVKTGGGTIVLAATNSYEGGTQINAGTLAISADDNLGLASGSLTFLGGTLAVTDDLSSAREFIFTSRGSVDVANGKTLTLSGPLSGAGQMVTIGQGNLILTGDAEIEQGFAVATGSRLQFGNGGSAGMISGNLLNEGTVTFNYSDALTYSEAISGRGELIKQGAGELTFAGASYFNGSLSVEAGRLTFAENAFIDAESVDIAAGGTLQTAGFALGLRTELTNAGTFEFEGFEAVRSASGSGDFNLGGYLILTGGTSTISGIVSGTGGLAVESVSSPVRAILSNQNTYTAPTIILSGSLALTGSGSVATSSGFQLGDAGVLDISATTGGATIRNLLGSGTINLGAKNLTVQSDLFSFFMGSISGTGGLIVESPGIFVLTRDQLYSGATRIQAGVLASASLPYSTVSLAAGAAFAPAASDTLAISVGGLQLKGGELWMDIQSAQADSIQIGAGGGQVNATTLIKFNAVNLINGQVYLLIDGLTPGWTLDQFRISGLPASGMLLMDPTGSGLYLSVYTGGYLSGSIIQNSYPVGTPTVANFLVNGAVTTDSQAQSNTINGLLFDPDSSLQIFNNLVVTSGSLNVPTGTATITGSNLVTPGNLSKLGSGVLNLLANALVNGTAQVEAGSLLVNGTLVASNGVVISPNALLGGSGMIVGNVLNNGTLSPGNSPGTLTVAGNLTLGSGGTTLLEIESLNVFDRIMVSGRATLGGTLNVVPYNGYDFKYGQQFTFLSAGGVAGEFDAVTMPENFRGRILVNSGNVTLVAAPVSYTQVAQNQNQLNVAAALDGFIPATSGDRLTVSTALDLLSEAQYPAAFDQISPAFYQSLTSTTNEQYNAQGQFLQQRFSSVALGRQAGFSTYGMNAPAFTEKTLDPKNPQSAIETPQSNWGLWTLGNGIFAKSSLASISGYRSESGGFLVGGDYRIGDTLVTGVFGGYQGTVSRYANGGRTTINAVRFGAYATYDSGNGFYANTVVGGGYSAYDAKRPIQFGNINRAASSAPGGAEFTSQLATGYDWKTGGFSFGPVGNVQYTYAGVGGFGENGAESLNLRVGQQNANSLRTTLGARAAYTWVVSDKIAIIPEVRMSWQHEFLMYPTGMSAALDGGSGPGFGYTSTAPARDAVFAGAGVTLQVGDRWNANVYYNADFGRSDYTSQMISGGLGISF